MRRSGMGDVTVMFTLSGAAFEALQAKARSEGSAPGSVLRAALSGHLQYQEQSTALDKSNTAFIGALRTLLTRDISDADNWEDLNSRLSKRGYDLRLAGNQLALYALGSDQCIADASEIGVAYGALMRRFEGPMPQNRAGGH